MCGYILQYSQARVTAWSNYFQKDHRIMQKCFLHHSLASRRPWAAPADLFLLEAEAMIRLKKRKSILLRHGCQIKIPIVQNQLS